MHLISVYVHLAVKCFWFNWSGQRTCIYLYNFFFDDVSQAWTSITPLLWFCRLFFCCCCWSHKKYPVSIKYRATYIRNIYTQVPKEQQEEKGNKYVAWTSTSLASLMISFFFDVLFFFGSFFRCVVVVVFFFFFLSFSASHYLYGITRYETQSR